MEGLRDSTTVSEANTTTTSGAYGNPERTESIPLKGSVTSSSGFLSRCLGLADEDGGDGLKFIMIAFFILSVGVTVALVSEIYRGDFQVVPHGSVATDSLNCSVIGTNILKKNGNAVDAAVASTLCMGVVNPHITGLGGGGFLLVYDHRKREVLSSLDFRETAPKNVSFPPHDIVGAVTVGVPGLVSGLYAAHKSHGKLSWAEVVKPAAEMARSGFLVPSSLVAAKAQLPPQPGPNSMLYNVLDTVEAGQILRLPALASTLETIANEGPDAFYNGSIAKDILTATEGGTLTGADLSSYHPVEREILHENFYGFDIIVPGAPSGGPLLLAALKSIHALNLSSGTAEDATPLLLYQQAQAIQQNYAVFFAESGDPDFSSTSTLGVPPSDLPETVASYVAAVDLNDLYVSVVSGHNSLFGSQIMTRGGFILNNALASFDPTQLVSEKPSTFSPVTASNLYSVASTPDGTIVSSPVEKIPDSEILLDHRTYPSKVVKGEKNPYSIPLSKPPAESQAALQRSKRFESSDTGPRTTLWGSSVANNGLAGGKRPISLATPIIAVQTGKICGRRLVLGGSDAGVAAQVLSQLLLFNGNVSSSIEYPRVRINPTGLSLSLAQPYASQLSPARRQQLTDLGFQMQPPTALNPSINVVEKIGDAFTSWSDSRGEGGSSRF